MGEEASPQIQAKIDELQKEYGINSASGLWEEVKANDDDEKFGIKLRYINYFFAHREQSQIKKKAALFNYYPIFRKITSPLIIILFPD